MKLTPAVSLALGVVCTSMAAGVLAETGMTGHQHDQHAHQAPEASKLSLDHGKKWQTDMPLRQSMQRINDAVLQAVPAYHNDSMTPAEAGKLSSEINTQIAYMIANCKLEPAADATLHVFIGELLAGAARMKDEPASPQGLPHIVRTLDQYTEYFDHPGL